MSAAQASSLPNLPAEIDPQLQDHFLQAVQSGDIETVWHFLQSCQVDIDYFYPGEISSETHTNALIEAAHQGHLDVAELLVAFGAQLNQLGEFGYCALDHAAWRGDAPMVHMLVNAGCFIDQQDDRGQTPYMNAGSAGNNKPKAEEIRTILRAPAECPRLFPMGIDAAISPAALFEQNEHQRCPLDHPHTWRQMGNVLHALEQEGEVLPLERWQEHNADGITWLERAAECFAFRPLAAHLHRQGVQITPDLLVDERTKAATPLLQKLARTYQLDAVFSYENLRGRSRQDVQAVYHAVPAPLRRQLNHYHALMTQLGRDEAALQQGRG